MSYYLERIQRGVDYVETRGPVQQLDHTVSYAYGTWLAQSGYRHTYGADLELYGAAYQPNSADSVLHYAIPIA